MSEEIISLAKKVLASYPIRPDSIRVIQSGGIKTVWKISSPQGTYCLKRLRHPLEKTHFSIQAQHFLASKKANVPAIIKNRDDELLVEKDGEVFVLYDWIPGNDLNFSRPDDLRNALAGLAVFHKASKGFVPSIPCRESTKWGRWPHQYQSMLERFKTWNSQKQPSSLAKIYHSHAETMISQGEQALHLLERSRYQNWIESAEKEKGLCHQDYGEGNALQTKNGVVVLDLDGATYDLPLRDLRKIIIKQMSNKGDWDPALLKKIISWYTAIHPLTSEQLQILYIDCFFPHEFHATAKNPFHKGKPISTGELAKAAAFEKRKAKHLLPLVR